MTKNQKFIIKPLTTLLISSSISMGISLNNDDQITSRLLQKPAFQQGTFQNLIYFETIPTIPITSRPILVYDTAEKLQVIGVINQDTELDIDKLYFDSDFNPMFLLSDGTYVEALKSNIYDDQIYSVSSIKAEYWLKGDFEVYTEPLRRGVEKQKHSFRENQKVTVESVASTHEGTFYKIKDSGWVASQFLSKTDTSMDLVQEMLTEKYGKNKNIAIYVKSLETGEVASVHEDTKMYAASVAKLPILYYTQLQLDEGDINLKDAYKNSEAVHEFKEAYDPDGSGNISKIPDNKKYSVETLMKAVAETSDNVASNMLAYYVTNQFDKDFYSVLNGITTEKWSMLDKEATVKTAAEVMEALYQQNGEVLNYLSQTDYDKERISKNISDRVAHKIGDAYDFKHDVAIVYTDSPFILSIFTDQSSYDDITEIADLVYGILK